MSQTIAISPSGDAFRVAITSEAIQLREDALAAASVITQVTGPQEEALAIQQASILKGIETSTERTRKQIKQPFLDAGKAIDAAASDYIAGITPRRLQIEGLITEHKHRVAAEAEARRRAELEALRAAEARAREEIERIAALQRREEELRAAAERAKTKGAQDKALAEALRIAEEKRQAEFDAAEARSDVANQHITNTEEATQSKGGAFTRTLDFEVIDIEAFAQWDRDRRAAHPSRALPSFVKVEVRRADFKQFINAVNTAEPIPGVRIFDASKFAARSINPNIELP